MKVSEQHGCALLEAEVCGAQKSCVQKMSATSPSHTAIWKVMREGALGRNQRAEFSADQQKKGGAREAFGVSACTDNHQYCETTRLSALEGGRPS